ncbi:serine hydrolase domain-containing protein [Lentzea aerocolonigenes]|uniref:serine hydrolase domain-containing protein n=1 Tax=Lentzea aerocolonigenes TaxID=68170 RepID=UPI00055EC64F|nr:serine hydrolase domain-containing protein [Lentzea aerocolonigenes]MCP2245427.1 CubicO group peptidase, beta-lactamase class C family [Lentzea aerocolonigenes]
MNNDFVAETARHFDIPGAAVGVFHDGQEHFFCHGVTSVENPLPVNENTLFLLGSVTKTYTATAIMRLVAAGRISLDAPVREYVPELELADDREFTVRQLLNHTSGLDWGTLADTGEGDDALARHVAELATLKLVAPVGERPSYSQSGFNLAGRIIENVTGQTYEQAITALLLEPLGLGNTHFDRDAVMTRRFAVGHEKGEVARPWRHWRANNPGGGIAASVADLLAWARFHLGDGDGIDLAEMRRPTASLRGSNLGDAIGVGWFLREIDGVPAIGHGGSSNGQFAELLIVPSRNFAVVSIANQGPDGIPFNQAVVRRALEEWIGVLDRDPAPLPYNPVAAQEVAGHYDNDAMVMTIGDTGEGLVLEVLIRPEIRESAEVELPADHAPFPMGLLPRDEYVITDGAFTGQRGFFTRDSDGVVIGVDLAGRMFGRVR